MADALLDDPSWLERLPVLVAVEVPILVVAVKLFARHRARRIDQSPD